MIRRLDRALGVVPGWGALRKNPSFRSLCGFEETLWIRKVADAEVRALVSALDPRPASALEVSGSAWARFGFERYHGTSFPEFDLCAEPLDAQFDLVIAEHVFEHLATPSNAARNVWTMLRPGGHFLVVTPFLYRVHPCPRDVTRWTRDGIRLFLADHGFPAEHTRTGSWGNRQCIRATLRREFHLFNRHFHSLANEPDYPMVVWALTRKPGAPA